MEKWKNKKPKRGYIFYHKYTNQFKKVFLDVSLSQGTTKDTRNNKDICFFLQTNVLLNQEKQNLLYAIFVHGFHGSTVPFMFLTYNNIWRKIFIVRKTCSFSKFCK